MNIQPTTYTSDKPDALFAGDFNNYPASTSGKLAVGQTGALKRGTALKRTAADTYAVVLAAEDVVHAVLAEDVTAGDNVKVTVYQKGQFNRNAVIFPATKTYADYALKSADFSIYFENSIK